MSVTDNGFDTGINPESHFTITCDPWRIITPVTMKNYYFLISPDTRNVQADADGTLFESSPQTGTETWDF